MSAVEAPVAARAAEAAVAHRSRWATFALVCAVVGALVGLWMLQQAVTMRTAWAPAALLVVVNAWIGYLGWRWRR
ncbi:hypothetical protein [Kineococcus sp. SYSU DK002]|uniref:hypothetical protein n=1 Tax=Kineococcus sp. SYSU DK002 TaxID=3383123 RepID=UPI003D7CE91B